jgi:hypothetical protein
LSLGVAGDLYCRRDRNGGSGENAATPTRAEMGLPFLPEIPTILKIFWGWKWLTRLYIACLTNNENQNYI